MLEAEPQAKECADVAVRQALPHWRVASHSINCIFAIDSGRKAWAFHENGQLYESSYVGCPSFSLDNLRANAIRSYEHLLSIKFKVGLPKWRLQGFGGYSDEKVTADLVVWCNSV